MHAEMKKAQKNFSLNKASNISQEDFIDKTLRAVRGLFTQDQQIKDKLGLPGSLIFKIFISLSSGTLRKINEVQIIK